MVFWQVDESALDSSQVKKECYLAYNLQKESRRKLLPKTLHLKGNK